MNRCPILIAPEKVLEIKREVSHPRRNFAAKRRKTTPFEG
jgi:hypothetical protein